MGLTSFKYKANKQRGDQMGVDGYEEYLEYKAEYFFEILKKKIKN